MIKDAGLLGKVALVTGGAQGIGRAVAELLATEGARVAIGGSTEQKALSAAAEIEAKGGTALGMQLEVSSRDSFRVALQRVMNQFGGIDIVVNNAGVTKPQPFLEASEEVWERTFRVNTLGVLIGMQEAAAGMIAQGHGGKIINTASIAGRSGQPDHAAYCASKAAVISLTQSGARALAKYGITVNAFAPGVVATPIWTQLNRDLFDMGATNLPDGAMDSMAGQILLGRVGLPADVAGTVMFLASSSSDYMTGQTLIIDGGMVLQ
jgi:meso-butanediol dehydrogenase / (S,S)-butanediol dehydrogenase / diacetyl reductase